MTDDEIIDQSVEEFAENVAAQTDAVRRGDSKAGNAHAQRYIEAFERLRSFGDRGRESLSRLFRHARPDVQGMAAGFLLRYKNEDALAVLTEISRRRDLLGLQASQCLKNWRNGKWNLDPQ